VGEVAKCVEWEGEAPAEPLSGARQRLGGSLALPYSAAAPCW
jgi:hypothetical protein